ncbi:MAG: AAA family ATPase [Dysgonamonadaceae bacterium]|jgi:hypothetical protein|nr:AAA family ATPase [Dysgonamonadaceae bacterium]
MVSIKTLRISFCEFIDNKLVGNTANKQSITLNCSEQQLQELNCLLPLIQRGNVFNLLNVEALTDDTVKAELIVFEPDYLIDISSLAECFKPYGNHYLNYTLARLQDRKTSPAILLGNTANYFLDELLNEEENFTVSLKKMFSTSAFEFTACDALKEQHTGHKFFLNCNRHFNNIRYAVQQFFPKTNIEREKAVLEPSFICNALGLQGRLDLMLSDFSAFVELKSGKALEDFRTGGQFIHSAENHYTQMILYLATLEFNLSLNPDDIRSYLLYSKYPVLSRERHTRKQLALALRLRNQIVAFDFFLQDANDVSITEEILTQISSINLNIKELEGKFFDNYLAPSIDKFAFAFDCLKEAEKTYFLRIYTFIQKELWLSKCGQREYEGAKQASCLWNATFDEKLAAAELLYNLKITENRAATDEHTIRLSIPEYPDLYLPNFRQGDAVVLYERNTESDTVNNRQVFRGAIESLEADSLVFRLRYKQKNIQVWNPDSLYAVEHDYMDSTFTGMFRALSTFLHANPDRKSLLTLPPVNTQDGICNMPLPVRLLIGPPGTGKTSIALKSMVEDELQKDNTNVLLISYTNRAVDEICCALSDIGDGSLEYIRIGSELNCASAFRPHLLENCLKQCCNRQEVAKAINKCRVFVGTAASVWGKPELFHLKHFDLAIVDEATQLLEPHLIGIFCIRDAEGHNAIERFTLIGDYKQLPAVVLQSREESAVNEIILNAAGLTNLADSLFERLYRQYTKHGLTAYYSMLTRQGRMHPDISAFPSEYFYEGLLESAGLPHQTEEWTQSRLQFFDVSPSLSDFSNKVNSNEAAKVCEICKALYQNCQENDTAFNPKSTGIITPYRSQIALIRRMLQETGIAGLAQINVDTVERFQGSQRDTIIYSICVKTENQLNALPNWVEENGKRIDRKLNVALTRARKQLFLTGNRRLLCNNEVYRKLMLACYKKKRVI